jgi:host factor-I protein
LHTNLTKYATKYMIELDITLPSIRHIHQLIRAEKVEEDSSKPQSVEVKLITGDVITGTLKWIDVHCICVSVSSNTLLVWHHAIAYIKS